MVPDDDEQPPCAESAKRPSPKGDDGGGGNGGDGSGTSSADPTYHGLSTVIALQRLHDDIETVLATYESWFARQSWFEKIRSTFFRTSTSPLGWFPALMTALCVLSLAVIDYHWSSFFLLTLLLLTGTLVVRENNLRKTEIFRKLRTALDEIRLGVELCQSWTAENYPHPCSPLSPCVSLQWTYRDGRIVNLPWALLVRGDHIVMRPGQVSPGSCREVNGKRSFRCGETYGLTLPTEPPGKPIARPPLPDMICAIEVTPYLDNLRTSLDCFLNRPTTIINMQRDLLISRCLQQWGFGVVLLLTVSIGILRNASLYFQGQLPADWLDAFLLNPTAAVLPILPLIFPALWVSVNLWGIARLETLLSIPQAVMRAQAQKSFQEDLDTPTGDLDHVELPRRMVIYYWWQLFRGRADLLGRSTSVVQVLGTITALCCVDKKGILSWPNPTAEKVFFLRNSDDDVHTVNQSDQSSLNSQCCQEHYHPLSHIIELSSQKEINGAVAEVLDLTHDQHSPFKLEFDDHDYKNHLTSLKPLGLAILVNTCCPLTQAHYAKFCGHVTAVAMLDKDLVPVTNRYAIVESSLNCFMHGKDTVRHRSATFAIVLPAHFANRLTTLVISEHKPPERKSEHGGQAPLLTQQLEYQTKSQYTHNSTKLSLLLVYRRCLCELARQIGFSPQARDIFNLEGQISSYRHLQPDVVRRDIRFARSLQLATKVKVPFPHSLSVVMREITNGSLQLLTQGTADIVLDCCDDYWDGHDLQPLTEKERKRAQDFYQRSALTAYCTAFAYRPLRHGISGALSGGIKGNIAYLELPPESKTRRDLSGREYYSDFEGGGAPLAHHSISTDSLLFTDSKDDDISDVDGCYEMQCHQVFIGMVTMQYQAQTDIVQLIERLERACIRFVHFSKENELRSRVFSEKMGLESGWNCHISLLSDGESRISSPIKNLHVIGIREGDAPEETGQPRPAEDESELNKLLPTGGLESTKALSSSAPGAISNPDSSLLEQGLHCRPPSSEPSRGSMSIRRASVDSAMVCPTNDEHCRSLSCLTDSTEQSAPINFDMSNRAKLPRGIENIRPHLENVDNVPLLVSLFTDCSAEATREMLKIMQQYGEIVVCLGSSASNSNSEIFLQGDCSIAIEPLYPQVCQEYPAYTEANIYNNRITVRPPIRSLGDVVPERNITISPVYLSRMLNSISCSVATCRDDPISIVAVIELSRRFIVGLWSCVQYWACCGASLAIMNTITAILSLPPMIVPLHCLYLMCVAVPAVALTLLRVEPDPALMKRATGKKQTCVDSRQVVFIVWCYGIKFSLAMVFLVFAYCCFLSRSIDILGTAGSDGKHQSEFRSGTNSDPGEPELANELYVARSFILLGTVFHFVTISSSFVHRDYNCFNRSPFSNMCWVMVAAGLLLLHTALIVGQICTSTYFWHRMDTIWPVVLFLILTVVLTFGTSEFFKWEEIKVNNRYIRRARLDFGTKLGMNSPF